MMRSMIIAAIATPVIAGFFAAALIAEGTTSTVTQSAEVGCTTALGERPNPQSTVTSLAGIQAADALASHPELSQATGHQAVSALDRLFTLANWRDLDRDELAAWVANPADPPPVGAEVITSAPVPAAVTDTQLHDVYRAQCQRTLDALTPEQLRNFLAPPATSTVPSTTTSRLHRAALDALGTQVTPDLTTFVAGSIGRQAPAAAPLSELLWSGPRVPPAFIAPGDVVFFDFAGDGPHQLAIVMDATTAATTTNLDGTSRDLDTLRTAPLPSGNVVFIRPADPVRMTTE